jgi:hypothetical protein
MEIFWKKNWKKNHQNKSQNKFQKFFVKCFFQFFLAIGVRQPIWGMPAKKNLGG